jgi:hypothetical protein
MSEKRYNSGRGSKDNSGSCYLDPLVRQFFRLRCQPTRIWVGEWAAQDSFYDGLIVLPVEREVPPMLRGRKQVTACRKDEDGRFEKFHTSAPLPQDGVEWLPLVNAERIHGGAGLPKPSETPTPLDGASC